MFKINPKVKKMLEEQIKNCGFCVVGEVHGVKENASFYKFLIKTFNFNCIALEWPERYKSNLNTYFKDPSDMKGVFNHIDEDGRFYIELLNILKEVYDSKRIEKIVFLDAYNPMDSSFDWNKRDVSMVKVLKENLSPELRMLVITGNLHTNKTPFINKGPNEERFPLGYHIRKELGEFPLITMRYLSGSYYNFGRNSFHESTGHVPDKILSTDKYEYEVCIKKATAVNLP